MNVKAARTAPSPMFDDALQASPDAPGFILTIPADMAPGLCEPTGPGAGMAVSFYPPRLPFDAAACGSEVARMLHADWDIPARDAEDAADAMIEHLRTGLIARMLAGMIRQGK